MNPRIILPLFFLCALGCEESFTPKGPYTDQLVAYSVLSPQSNVHYVRLLTTYNPPGFDPFENTNSHQITNATVSIFDGTNTLVLRDTTVPRTDTGRYSDSIRAFVASPLQPVRGRAYTLTITSPPFGTLTGSTVVPGAGVVELDQETRIVLLNPLMYRGDMIIYGTPWASGVGYVIRLYLEYEVFSTDTVVKREEVPLQISNYQGCASYDSEYPALQRRSISFGREFLILSNLNYRRTIIKVKKLNEGKMVNFRRAVIIMSQADQHLYNYYSLVNGFQDEFSIRVDLPNYTNIQGGLGLFGSFASDSLLYSLQTGFPGVDCSE